MTIQATRLDALRAKEHGRVLAPGEVGFAAAAAGFNLAHQHHPDLVVAATDTTDVSAAVRFAADEDLQVRVQSTGHGIGTGMNGGMLVVTSAMDSLAIDSATRRVRVGAGVRWAQVVDAAAPYGLATLCGSSPTVGAVGYTLGGGIGPMARTFGFNSDRVRALRMVDASGDVIDVDPGRQPDLFWALRGGKPALGIVTELEFDLVDAPTYYGGLIVYAAEDGERVLREFAAWGEGLPEQASTSIALVRLPDIPQLPEPLRGKLTIQLRFVHVGDPDAGEALLAPMRAVAPPVIDDVGLSPAHAIASVHRDPTEPMPARDEGMLLASLPTGAIDALLAVAGPRTEVPLIVVEIRLMGGALAREGEHPSAVGGRHGAYAVTVIGAYPPPLQEAVDRSTAAVLRALAPWSAPGTLINFQGSATSPEAVRGAWSPQARSRLLALNNQWDPDGRFRFAYPLTA